jgi:GH15 family glucan-1,4-alpha-glucosidase
MAYPAIGDHALLGDGHTAALVTSDGTIDWLPWPDFDSATLFASLLDTRRGGRFTIEVPGAARRRRYLPHTNILETSCESAAGRALDTDFLAVGARALVRMIEVQAGRLPVKLTCTPRPAYGLRAPRLQRIDERSIAIEDLALTSSHPLELEEGRIHADWTLAAGERAWLCLGEAAEPQTLFESTLAFWRGYAARLRTVGPFAEAVERAALVLKALSYWPSGALISAATTSLPDRKGAQHGADHRYAWLHDGAIALAAFDRVDAEEEARALYRFLLEVARARHPARVHAFHGVRGEEELHERELIHLAGYRGARPVRVGNGSTQELEHNLFAELLEALARYGGRFPSDREDLRSARGLVDWVAHHWRDPDVGLWEERSRRRAFVHSKAASWRALDLGLSLFAEAPDQWRRERDAIFADVVRRGFDERLGAFVQAYDCRILDASTLRLPLMRFLPADDPRMLATVEQIRRHLMPEGVVLRWQGGEPFTACSFWLAELLTMQGRADEAEPLIAHALSFANDLGLYAEELDVRSRTQWGNFPCAAAHAAVVSAVSAVNDRRENRVASSPEAPGETPGHR